MTHDRIDRAIDDELRRVASAEAPDDLRARVLGSIEAGTRGGWMWRPAAVVAAAALVLILAWPLVRRDDAPPERRVAQQSAPAVTAPDQKIATAPRPPQVREGVARGHTETPTSPARRSRPRAAAVPQFAEAPAALEERVEAWPALPELTIDRLAVDAIATEALAPHESLDIASLEVPRLALEPLAVGPMEPEGIR